MHRFVLATSLVIASPAFRTAHSETPNDSTNGEMIDTKVIFVFLQVLDRNSSLFWAFGEFSNVVSRDHAYANRRKGVFYPKMLQLSRKRSHIH
jgi:hypothetical protein